MPQSQQLTVHFTAAAIDGIVPPLDVDAARKARRRQIGNEPGPVGIAQPGKAVKREALRTERTVPLNQVMADLRVLSVKMEDPRSPLRDPIFHIYGSI